MRPRLMIAVVALCFLPTVVYQQQVRDGGTTNQVTGTAAISGLLLNGDATPAPVRRALVTLSGSTLAMDLLTSTDESGRFAFVGLPAGRFIVSASKTGYVRDSYGSHQPGGAGSPVVLTAAGERLDLRMTMTRAAVIAGSVRLPSNAPTSSVRLQLLKYGLVNGQRRLVSARGGAYGVGDDGDYRLSGLVAGEYVVVASVWNTGSEEMRLMDTAATGPQPRVGFAPTFYPGEADPGRAVPVAVRAGEERLGVDFTLRLVPTSRFDGRIVDPEGKPLATVQASLTDATPVPRPAILVRPGPDGRFSVTGLAPGRYVLSVRAATGAAPAPAGRGGMPPLPLWANREFEFSGSDLSDVVVALQPGRTVSGRITFEPGAASIPASPGFLQVGLEESQSQASRPASWWTFANDDGTFAIAGVPPGRHRFVVRSMPDNRSLGAWVLKSALAEKRDILDDLAVVEPDRDLTNIVVSFTDRPAEIGGVLLDASGKPAPEYFVVAFSADRRFWIDGSRRTISMRPGRDGSFTWTGVPPGDYYLGALTRLESGQLGDASFIESLIPTSIKVSVAEGEKKRQDLRIGG